MALFRMQAYCRQGNYSLALSDAEWALKIDKKNGKSLYRKGVCLLMLPDKAISENVLGVFEALVQLGEVEKGLYDDVGILMQQAKLLDVFHSEDHPPSPELEDILMKLHNEIDGIEDIDVETELDRLALLLEESDEDIFAFLQRQGHRILWYFFTEATCNHVAKVMHCHARSAILWPDGTWSRLLSIVCGSEGSCFATCAIELVCKAARDNAWVKNHLLPKPCCGDDSFIQKIVGMIGRSHLMINHPGNKTLRGCCVLLSLYAEGGAASSSVLQNVGRGCLTALLEMFLHAGDESKITPDKQESINVRKIQEEDSDPEILAKLELQKKKDSVYNSDVVSSRRDALLALQKLVGIKGLLMEELIIWKDGKKMAGQLHHILISTGRFLIDKCPQKTTPMLDQHLNPSSYGKRKFAANFMDNPTGDFLAKLNLEDAPQLMVDFELKQKVPMSDLLSESGQDALIDIYLESLKILLSHRSTFISKMLHRAGLISVCEEIFKFVPSRTVLLAQQVFASLVNTCQEARSEAFAESSTLGMASLIKYLDDLDLANRAVKELCCVVPSCKGDDYAGLVDSTTGALANLIESATHQGYTKISNDQLPLWFKLISLLAKRCIDSGKFRMLKSGHKIPKGFCWSAFNTEDLDDLLYSQERFESPKLHSEPSFASIKKGFLGVQHSTTSIKKLSSAHDNSSLCSKPEPSPGDKKENNKPIENNKGTERGPKWDTDHKLSQNVSYNHSKEGSKDDDDDLHEIYDSTPSEEIRTLRVRWLAIPVKERVRWEQTSNDLSIWVKLPKKTSAKEIQVSVSPGSISVILKWYGKVLEGNLYGKVKSNEITWCVEDDELHIDLRKDVTEHWWKTLIQGWEEKGYYELLQDAVNADEPHTSYDDMDESAKELLESIVERQAYVNSGMLDLENSFDDFRIVLSEESLGGNKPSSSQKS